MGSYGLSVINVLSLLNKLSGSLMENMQVHNKYVNYLFPWLVSYSQKVNGWSPTKKLIILTLSFSSNLFEFVSGLKACAEGSAY